MIDQIINKVTEILKKDPSLFNVREWRKINGMVPSNFRTVSVSCDDLNFTEYTNTLDECNAVLKIYASLDNRELSIKGRKGDEDRLEYGERAIHEFAENIKFTLTDDYSLNGLIDASSVDKIEFVTTDEYTDLHIAVISFAVKYYAERSKNYRSFTMAIEVTNEKMITVLPITPVIDIVNIGGFEKGKDYETVDNGIKWLNQVAAGTYTATWKFDAASAKVAKIGMIVNDEVNKFGGE